MTRKRNVIIQAAVFTALILPAIGCEGFGGAFYKSSGDAFKGGRTVYLPGADGEAIPGKTVDIDNDNLADGIDLNGDGIAELLYIWIVKGKLAGLDVNGDSKIDYYMNIGLNDKVRFFLDQAGQHAVTLVKDADGNVIGFDTTGDGKANNTILADISNDTTAPTSLADSSGGTFNKAQTVTVTCTDNIAGNSISYTLDGSTPGFSGNGTLVVGTKAVIEINGSGTLRWTCRDSAGNLQTTEGRLEFDIIGAFIVLPPVHLPGSGTFGAGLEVSLESATTGATVCMSLDDSDPICAEDGGCSSGQQVSAAVTLNSTTSLRSRACHAGQLASKLTQTIYIIDSIPPSPVSSLNAGAADSEVDLIWVNPLDSDLAGIRILRKTDSFPSGPEDGTVVFNALGSSLSDSALTNSTTYYYSVFTFDAVGNYSTAEEISATPHDFSIAAPTYSPPAGLYGNGQSVTISSVTPSTTLCYSLDGSTPACDAGACTTGVTYSAPVAVSTDAVLRAMACRTGYFDSGVSSGSYTIDTTAPAEVSGFNAAAGNGEITLNWSNPGDTDLAGIKIMQRSDTYPADENDGTVAYNSTGTTITVSSLSNGTTYYYTAFTNDNLGNYSSGSQASATPLAGTVNTPVFTPVTGVYGSAQNVAITSTTPSALICYTTNGDDPACSATPACTTGLTYGSAVNVNSDLTLKAIACKFGYSASAPLSGGYIIDTTPPTPGTAVTFSSVSATGLTVEWGAASDDNSAAGSLLYRVVKDDTAAANIDTVLKADAKNGADLLLDYSAGSSSVPVSGLTNGTDYYFAVVVQDEAGNKALYTPAVQQTVDTTSPTVSTAISFSSVTAYTLTVNWGAGSDNTTPVGSLEYKLVKDDSAAANIDTAAEADAKGGADLLLDWTAAATSHGVTGLIGAHDYYFAVLVRDEGGNMSLYSATGQTTSNPPPGDIDPTFDTTSAANSSVYTINSDADGKIVISGNFTSYDGTARQYMARLHVDASLDASFVPAVASSYFNHHCILSNGKILAGGWFSTVDTVNRRYLFQMNSDGSWDTSFAPPSNSPGSNIQYVTTDNSGQIYIAGSNNLYYSGSKQGIVRINTDASIDTGFDSSSGTDSYVEVIGIDSNNKPIIAGSFIAYGGVTRERLARLNTDGTLDTSYGTTSGADSYIKAMVVLDNDKVLIGGDFTSYAGTTREHIALINSDGSLDTSLDSSIGANGVIHAIAVQTDGKIIIGGEFTIYGAYTRNKLARINTDGSIDLTFDPGSGPGGNIYSLYIDDNGMLLVGGTFTDYDGVTAQRLVRVWL